MLKKTKNRKTFTIVELVIVIAVIAILAAVLIPTFSGIVSKSHQSSALQTARNSLTSALNMSSTASLPGKDDDGNYRTVFLVDGYAFGYDQGELAQIDYPKGSTKLEVGVNFNTLLVAAENTAGNDLNESISKVILDATNLGDKVYAATLDGSTYITDGAAVCSCFLNSDLSKKVVVLTTFANEITAETKAAIIDSLGLGGYVESASGTGNTVDFGDIH